LAMPSEVKTPHAETDLSQGIGKRLHVVTVCHHGMGQYHHGAWSLGVSVNENPQRPL
jgi:hypothetical protein